MKKFLILMIVLVSNLLLLSACSSDNDESGDSKARYYIKYTVTGGSWYRPPFRAYFKSNTDNHKVSRQK